MGEKPRFDQIQTADIKPALQTAIAEACVQIAEVEAQTHTDWANIIERLADIAERVGRVWGVVSHLDFMIDTSEPHTVYNELMLETTIFLTRIGQNIELYNRFKTVKNSPGFATLSPAQQAKLSHNLRDFAPSGARLPSERQAELVKLQAENAQLSTKFS